MPPQAPPPQYFGQPGMMLPPMGPPPKAKRGWSWGQVIVTSVATIIFLGSLGLNLLLLVAVGMQGGNEKVRQEVVLEGAQAEKIGVIGVRGVITAASFNKFDRLLREVEKDKSLKALVIDIDTPGGAVTASDQIYQRILRFKSDMEAAGRSVPVVASIGSIGTSGGYYVACATDHIFAERTALTGNIGVLLPRFNVHKLAEKYGIEETTIVSNGAPFKNAGSMFTPERPAETAYIQKIADDAFTAFKDVVRQARQTKLKAPLTEVADGRAFFAPDAVTVGLIDATGTAADAYAYAAAQAQLSKPHVVRYDDPPSLLGALSGEGEAMGGTSIQFDGKAVRVNAGEITDLLTPRLMYLWRGD